MHVHLTFADVPGIQLEEAADCRRLDVRVPADLDISAIVEVLSAHGAGVGVDEDHVNLSTDWLRRAALLAQPAADPAELDAMLAFADSHGWCTQEGAFVRAHLEREHVA